MQLFFAVNYVRVLDIESRLSHTKPLVWLYLLLLHVNFSVDLTFPCIVEKKNKEYILQKVDKEYSFSASVLSCLSLYNDIYHAFFYAFSSISDLGR